MRDKKKLMCEISNKQGAKKKTSKMKKKNFDPQTIGNLHA
jgi:hypothetical protein